MAGLHPRLPGLPSGRRRLPNRPRSLHRTRAVRAGNGADLREGLDLCLPRKRARQAPRLRHDARRSPTADHHPRWQRRAACTDQRLPAPRRHPHPRGARQPVHLHLSVPRLVLQERRPPGEGQGTGRIPRWLQQGHPRPEEGAHPELQGLRLRQPRHPGQRFPGRLPGRCQDLLRHDGGPVADRRAGDPAGQVHLHLRRQLEAAERERPRRLSRQHRALQLRLHRAAPPAGQRRERRCQQHPGLQQARRRRCRDRRWLVLLQERPQSAVQRHAQPPPCAPATPASCRAWWRNTARPAPSG
ncbi:hypothetical protein Q3H58_000181 [Pseudomonas psychrotolerans]|nr:hypothetical protein [Pseudomonas psychrotolerans]